MSKERTAQRKDRNVAKSSHGKFNSVANLVGHQSKVSRPHRHVPAERIAAPGPSGNWLTRER